jgi:hypothetical protein
MKKFLVLAKETLRSLDEEDLSTVAGGGHEGCSWGGCNKSWGGCNKSWGGCNKSWGGCN